MISSPFTSKVRPLEGHQLPHQNPQHRISSPLSRIPKLFCRFCMVRLSSNQKSGTITPCQESQPPCISSLEALSPSLPSLLLKKLRHRPSRVQSTATLPDMEPTLSLARSRGSTPSCTQSTLSAYSIPPRSPRRSIRTPP